MLRDIYKLKRKALKKTLAPFLITILLLLGCNNMTSAQYCTTVPLDCTDGDRIVNIQLSNLNHSPTCNPSTGYNNYTTSIAAANVAAGTPYTVRIEVGYEDDDAAIWIDYNQNNIFETSEFTFVGTSTSINYNLSTTVNIPATALPGSTRMRVISYYLLGLFSNDACMPFAFPFDYGEVNDYTINITGASTSVPGCVTAPTAPANAGSVCVGSTTLSWPAVTGATGYDVYLNTGATAATLVSTNQAGTTYNATVAAGPYAWRVVPKNSAGSATGCATFTFTASPPVVPAVSITAAPTGAICAGIPVTFTATAVNGGTTPAYQWKKGTTNVGTNASTYTDNTLTATDVISVVMTSNAACATPATATSNTITPTIVTRPTATITPAGATTFCDGSSLTLNANTGTGLTYQWLRNNANITAATGAAYTAGAAGSYVVIVSNGTCKDTSAAISLTVLTAPIATISPSGTNAICQGSSQVLTGPAPATGLTFTWLLNGAIIPGANTNTYTAATAGNYRLVLSNGSCSDTSAISIIQVNPKPAATATAAGATTFCTGGSVVLNASTATGVTYQWLRNTAIIAGATTASYTATTSGVYAVVIRNTTTSCADTSNPAIPVLASTAPSNVLTVVGTLTFCEGGSVRLQAATGTGFTYAWYRNNVLITGATTASYTITTAGVYYAVITNGACATTTATRTVVVNPLPVAAVTPAGPTAFCNGGSVVLNANTGAGFTYQWRMNSGNITGATSPSYTATVSGDYSVVISNGSCTNASSDITINVSTMPVPVITPVGPSSFCQGGSVVLDATTGAGYTYQWQLNGSDIAGATASAYSATLSGQYTVIITNGACVATSAPITVSVTPAPVADITPAGPTSFCQGGEVLLNASRGTGYTYQWTKDGVAIPGATNFQYAASASGDYAVDISNGICPASSAPVTVTVGAIPVAVITVTGGVTMSTDPFAGYQWYRNGVVIAGATAQTYTAVQDGYYAVVVTDGLGCSATSPVQLITALDISHANPAGMAVKVWPNPAVDMIHVEVPAVVDMTITAVDGKELIRNNKAKQVDLSMLPPGIYLLRITDHQSGALIAVDRVVKH
jgi:hypothetical protein